ncbi:MULTISPECIES: hypothetical protein [unclassified Microcoleus]|uniref:hypothetical protein n=1 Tax=unclassified Microcoleus TaxID=2642155 RepID=UPI002FD1F41F
MKRDPTDMRTYPVRQQPCKTCPFSGEKPLPLSPSELAVYYDNLMGNGQHICHSMNNTKICRGGRNIQLKWLCAIGMLDEPTDEAFNEAVNGALNNKESATSTTQD